MILPAPGSVPHPLRCGPHRALRRWLAAELRWLRPVVHASAARCQAERYRKHFDAFAHLCLLLFHGFSGNPSLRQSYAAFAGCPGLVALSGLAHPHAPPEDERLAISFSQFAASNTTRPAAFLAGLVSPLLARVRAQGRATTLPATLHVLDSTFLRLSLHLAPWLPVPPGAEVPGVRVQVQYAPALDLPEHVLVTDTRTPDGLGWDHLVLEQPARLATLQQHTLVLDLGYYSHRRFARAQAAGVHLVSRCHPQATIRVVADLPCQPPLPALPAHPVTVLQDQRVTIGSPHYRTSTVLPGWRRIRAVVQPRPKAIRQGAAPVVYALLTDRWDLPATDVVALYRARWQIELFFRWLKHQVHLPRVLGYSRNAVELTVWLALLVHLLTLLASTALGGTRRSPTLLCQLRWAFAHLPPSAESSRIPVPLPLIPP